MASLHFIKVKILLIYLMNGCSQANQQCTASIGGTCPSTWSQWGDKCYKVTERLTWFEAQEECVKVGGVMAAPHSMAENEHLLRSVKLGSVWINCNDLHTEGVWECKEGMTYIHYREWGDGQPSNRYGNEHCAVARQNDRPDVQGWNDVPCDWKKSAVCKKPVPMLHF